MTEEKLLSFKLEEKDFDVLLEILYEARESEKDRLDENYDVKEIVDDPDLLVKMQKIDRVRDKIIDQAHQQRSQQKQNTVTKND